MVENNFFYLYYSNSDFDNEFEGFEPENIVPL